MKLPPPKPWTSSIWRLHLLIPPHLRIDYIPINNRISGQGITVNIRLKMQEGERRGSSTLQENVRVGQITSGWVRVIQNSPKLSNWPYSWSGSQFICIMHRNHDLGSIGFTQSLATWVKVEKHDPKVTKKVKSDNPEEKNRKPLKSPIWRLYFVPVPTHKHIPSKLAP